MKARPRKKASKLGGKQARALLTGTAATANRGRAVPDVGSLLERIVTILDEARGRVVRAVNSEMVLAYWHIGREIVEYHQAGAVRAECGDQVLEELSAELRERVGRGYSVTNLRCFRLFYQVYAERAPKIHHEPRDELGRRAELRREARDGLEALSIAARPDRRLEGFSSRLSWTHYRTLTKVENREAILERQARAGWGAKVVDRLAHDLAVAFPDAKGFSSRNLKYMRRLAEAWPEPAIVQQLLHKVPWFHLCTLLDRVKDAGEREWYLRAVIQHGWSRSVLVSRGKARDPQSPQGAGSAGSSSRPTYESASETGA